MKLPNPLKITKNAMLIFLNAAKVYKLDAALAIIIFIAIVVYALDKQDRFSLEGAAAVLFVYAFACTIRLKILRDERDEARNS